MKELIRPSLAGPYCEAGGFYVDPWKPVERAVITHAHSDHARGGMGAYLCSEACAPLLRERLGETIKIETLAYGERRQIGNTVVSLHPAGHLLGSAQVRVEHKGEVWVVTGDYKRQEDASCERFELVECNTFVTESTFGLPIYQWRRPEQIIRQIINWWRDSIERERACVLFAYSLGKTQRLLAALAAQGELPGPMATHYTSARLNAVYREQGMPVPEVQTATAEVLAELKGKGLLIAPQSMLGSNAMRKLGPYSTAFASGWMAVRGMRRWRSLDRGFAISDHVDWPQLMQTIRETGAERIGVTHGYTQQVVRYLQEQGMDAFEFPTRYTGETQESEKNGETANAAELEKDS